MGRKHDQVNYDLGCALYNQRKYNEAISHFNICLKQDSRNIESLYMRSLSYLQLKQDKEAQVDLDKIIQFEPKNHRSHYLYGCILYVWEKYKESIAAQQACLKINPDYSHAYAKMGQGYAALKQNNEAHEMFQKAIALESSYDIYYSYGFTLYSMQQYEASLTALNQSIKLNPAYYHTHYYIGLTLFALKKNEEAEFHFKECVITAPDNLDAWDKYARGLVLLKKDMPELMKFEWLHLAVLAADVVKVKELLTDKNHDLKDKDGKTALQLLFDKHTHALNCIETYNYTVEQAQLHFTLPIREVMVLLLQKGAETTTKEQLLLIRIGIDVISIKSQLLNQLIKTQRQQTPLFRQIEKEQADLKQIMKSFSVDLQAEVQQKTHHQEEQIAILTERSETMESTIKGLIEISKANHTTDNMKHVHSILNDGVKLQSHCKNLFGGKSFYVAEKGFSIHQVEGHLTIAFRLSDKVKIYDRSFPFGHGRKYADKVKWKGFDAIRYEGGYEIKYGRYSYNLAIINNSKYLKPIGVYSEPYSYPGAFSVPTIRGIQVLGITGALYATTKATLAIVNSDEPVQETVHQAAMLSAGIWGGMFVGTKMLVPCAILGSFTGPFAPYTIPLCIASSSAFGGMLAASAADYTWNIASQINIQSSALACPSPQNNAPALSSVGMFRKLKSIADNRENHSSAEIVSRTTSVACVGSSSSGTFDMLKRVSAKMDALPSIKAAENVSPVSSKGNTDKASPATQLSSKVDALDRVDYHVSSPNLNSSQETINLTRTLNSYFSSYRDCYIPGEFPFISFRSSESDSYGGGADDSGRRRCFGGDCDRSSNDCSTRDNCRASKLN